MSRNLGSEIDTYLAGRSSPMAGHGRTFVQAGRRYGVDPRLLVGIATIESGAGQHMKNPHNPFNWGVHRGQEYPSFDAAIEDVARGLRRNYLDDGLETPDQIVRRYAPSSDGNNESNWASVVSSVMQQLGGAGVRGHTRPLPPQPTTVKQVAQQAQQPKLEYDPLRFSTGLRDQFIAGAGRVDLGSQLPNLVEQSWSVVRPPPPPAASPARQGAPAGDFAPRPTPAKGGFLQLPTKWKTTHVTDGLSDEGFTHAEDIMGAPGTQLGAPVGGTVEYFHPTGAQGGGSMMIRGEDGREYWLGHIANGVPAGTKVQRGQIVAVISGDHPRPHVHIDYR